MNALQLWLVLGDRLGPLVTGLVSRSVGALWLLGVILVLRLVLRRGPRRLLCLLWLLLALRLALPVQLTSPLSLLWNTGATVSAAGERQYVRQLEGAGFPDLEIHAPVVKTARLKAVTFTAGNSDYAVSPLGLLAPLWPLGCLGLLLYAAFSALGLRRRLREAVRLEDNVWLSDRIDGPFLFGLFRPRIYLPADLPEPVREPVLRHERAHLARLDPWWKLLGWLLLSVFWFDPFLWLAYFLFCRDLELSCDERVIRALPEEERKRYASALLECSIPRPRHRLAPLAFGESGIRSRLKAVLNYRRPAFWLVLAAVLLILAAAVFFGTDPPRHHAPAPVWTEPQLSEALDGAVRQAVLEHDRGLFGSGGFPTEAHLTLALEENEGETTVWVSSLYMELSWDGTELRGTGGIHVPVRLRFRGTELTEYREPREDRSYEKELLEILPEYITPAQEEELSQDQSMALCRSCYAQAVGHFGIDTDALCERLFLEVLAARGEEVRDKLHNAPLPYQRLRYLGDYAVRWAMLRFLGAEAQDHYTADEKMEYDLLWRVLQDLTGGSATHLEPGLYQATGLHCWWSWLRQCEQSEQGHDMAFLEKHFPYEALALKLSRAGE